MAEPLKVVGVVKVEKIEDGERGAKVAKMRAIKAATLPSPVKKTAPTRPTDILRKPHTPPLPPGSTSIPLPDSWKTVLEAANTWPFPDPDETFSRPDESLETWEADHTNPVLTPFSDFEPWGKMEDEIPHHYMWFSHFRSLGRTRTRTEVGRHFDVSVTTINKIALKYEWDTRVAAWDDYRERLYTAELLDGVKKMAHDHAEVAAKGIEALSSAFEALVERMSTDPDSWREEMGEISLKSLYAIVQRSAQVLPNLMNAERLSRGLPTEISASLNVNVSDTRVTIQSRDDLASIVAGLAGIGIGPGNGENPDVLDVRNGDSEAEEEPHSAA